MSFWNKTRIAAAGLWIIGLLWMAAPSGSGAVDMGPEPGLRTATFYVGCYNTGEVVLEGLPGVKHIGTGFRDSREINTVTYDPSKITEGKMVEALVRAGTYHGTAPETGGGTIER